MASRSNDRRKSLPKKSVPTTTRGKKAGASKKQEVTKDFSFTPRTELGKKLWELRSRAVASGMKLLNSDELEQEVLSRRAGVLTND
jgi:hypothetical protein